MRSLLRSDFVDRLGCELQGLFLIDGVFGTDSVDEAQALTKGLLQNVGLSPAGASRTNPYMTHQLFVYRKGGFDPCHIAILPYCHPAV